MHAPDKSKALAHYGAMAAQAMATTSFTESRVHCMAQRMWDSRAPYLVTLMGVPHISVFGGMYCFPQARAVMDDHGSLVLVEPLQ